MPLIQFAFLVAVSISKTTSAFDSESGELGQSDYDENSSLQPGDLSEEVELYDFEHPFDSGELSQEGEFSDENHSHEHGELYVGKFSDEHQSHETGEFSQEGEFYDENHSHESGELSQEGNISDEDHSHEHGELYVGKFSDEHQSHETGEFSQESEFYDENHSHESGELSQEGNFYDENHSHESGELSQEGKFYDENLSHESGELELRNHGIQWMKRSSNGKGAQIARYERKRKSRANCVKQKIFKLLDRKLPWYEGEQACRAGGMRLASTRNKEEFEKLRSTARSDKKVKLIWIGLNNLAEKQRYRWADGSLLEDGSFNAWGQKQPQNIMYRRKEECVLMDWNDKLLWHDYPCNFEYYVACEHLVQNCPEH